jgi:hypothetical protein
MKNYIFPLILMILILNSCHKDVGPVEPDHNNSQVSFSRDVQPIFDNYCVSCHPNSGNLDLRRGHSYDQLVNVPASGYNALRVKPGDAESSVLYKKVDGSGAYGSNMPLGSSLSASQISLIRDWINQGARQN